MKPILVLLSLICLALPALAGPPLILDADALTDGSYVLTIANGQVVSFKRGTVLTLGDDPVTPQPPTGDVSLQTLTAVSKAEYAKITADATKEVLGATIATVYRAAAANLRSGTSSIAQANDQVNQIRDAMPAEWEAWRSKTAATWNALQDKQLILTADQWAAAMEAVAAGIASEAQVVAQAAAFGDAEQIIVNGLALNPFIEDLIKLMLQLIDKSGTLAKFLPLILALLGMITG